jgi:hypothetical protein
MTDKIPFKCSRCGATWEKTIAELNEPKVTVYRGEAPRKYTYRSPCPDCGTPAVTDVNVTGDRHA